MPFSSSSDAGPAQAGCARGMSSVINNACLIPTTSASFRRLEPEALHNLVELGAKRRPLLGRDPREANRQVVMIVRGENVAYGHRDTATCLGVDHHHRRDSAEVDRLRRAVELGFDLDVARPAGCTAPDRVDE